MQTIKAAYARMRRYNSDRIETYTFRPGDLLPAPEENLILATRAGAVRSVWWCGNPHKHHGHEWKSARGWMHCDGA